MSKLKFKVGDKVRVVKITGSADKAKYVGKKFTINFICENGGYKYSLKDSNGLSNEWYYSDEELELADRTYYTGIELLQAIKDGVFKNGDKFNLIGNYGKHIDVIKFKSGFIVDSLQYSNGFDISIDEMLNFTFSPYVKEPINLAPEDKRFAKTIPVDILNTRKEIDVYVFIKGNIITVELSGGIKGVAKCSPEDKFDQDKGIRLAFTRAIKKQTTKDLDKNIAELVK